MITTKMSNKHLLYVLLLLFLQIILFFNYFYFKQLFRFILIPFANLGTGIFFAGILLPSIILVGIINDDMEIMEINIKSIPIFIALLFEIITGYIAITFNPFIPIDKKHYCVMDSGIDGICQTFIWSKVPGEIFFGFSLIFGIIGLGLLYSYEN